MDFGLAKGQSPGQGKRSMSFNSLFALIFGQPTPPLFFVAGMVAAVIICTFVMLIDARIRMSLFRHIQVDSPKQSYQHFRLELARTARHLDFAADEIQELHDDDFVA